MTPTTLDLYMITRLGPLATLLECATAFAILSTIMATVTAITADRAPDREPGRVRLAAALAALAFALGLLRVLVPTTPEAFAMVVLPRASMRTSPEALAPAAIEAARGWLDSISSTKSERNDK